MSTDKVEARSKFKYQTVATFYVVGRMKETDSKSFCRSRAPERGSSGGRGSSGKYEESALFFPVTCFRVPSFYSPKEQFFGSENAEATASL